MISQFPLGIFIVAGFVPNTFVGSNSVMASRFGRG
jgi:hypothetical protein